MASVGSNHTSVNPLGTRVGELENQVSMPAHEGATAPIAGWITNVARPAEP